MSFLKEAKVVITGIGIITPLGIGIKKFWKNLLEGRSNISVITKFNTDKYICKIASVIADKYFNFPFFLSTKDSRRYDRYIQLSLIAAKLAIYNANINLTLFNPYRVGTLFTSGVGGIRTVEIQIKKLYDVGAKFVSPYLIPSYITNMASGIISIYFKTKGGNFSTTSACASSTHAVGESFNKIKTGELDIILAGGSEAAVTSLSFAGFCSMKAMSSRYNKNPLKASRPFDYYRSGFIMGEGACVLLLENLTVALKRKAKIYSEILSYTCNSDGYHITTPKPSGLSLKLCVIGALKYANIDLNDIDYINAHGTSTKFNDIIESLSLKYLLNFYKTKNTPVINSTKSITGHMLGASGAVEIGVCALAIFSNSIPPTINYEFPDKHCSLYYNPNYWLRKEIKFALTINLGFGGHNACLVLKKFTVKSSASNK